MRKYTGVAEKENKLLAVTSSLAAMTSSSFAAVTSSCYCDVINLL
jgi:hypothetical protein